VAWAGFVTQGQSLDIFLGRVHDGVFLAFEPHLTAGSRYRLTSIGMQEAVSPEAGELELTPYENKVLVVQGHDAGGWLYSATILEVAPPLIAEFLVEQHSPPSSIKPCSTEVIFPLFCPRDHAIASIMLALEKARQSVDIIASTLPGPPLIASLENAATQGVLVRILLKDAGVTEPADAIAGLMEAGAKVKKTLNSAPAFIIIDGETVILGVENWLPEPWPEQQPILFLECPVLTAAQTPVERFCAEFEDSWSQGCRP
jgi:hypothetical protein